MFRSKDRGVCRMAVRGGASNTKDFKGFKDFKDFKELIDRSRGFATRVPLPLARICNPCVEAQIPRSV
jgi:hypothetical protein